jgi:hypothetical protein
MATISFTIPDNIAARVVDAIVYNNGYADQVYDTEGNQIPNPVSKSQWAKDVLKRWIKGNVVTYESARAADAARQAAIDAANTEIIIGD